MKRFAPTVLFAVVFALFAAPLFSATVETPAPSAAVNADQSPARGIATAITTLTGIAISPLLGTGGFGFYQWYRADTPAKKSALPWFAQPSFFIPALLIAGICAMKDALGTVLPPGFKKPLDVLETIENKISGLVAAGAIVPFTMSAVSSWILDADAPATTAAHHLSAASLAMLPWGSGDFSWMLNVLTIPVGLVIFAIVWMAGHAINVLILLSPWGAIDAILKAARTSVLGLLAVTAALDPKLGLILAAIIILFSWLVAGWSFRLMIFGTLFSWDFFTLRKKRFRPHPASNRLFSGGKLKGAPIRSYGRLIHQPENGRLLFTYKPWLVLPERTVDVMPTAPYIAKGLFFSSIGDGELTLFLLPPRYRDHEEDIARIYQLEGGVKDAGLMKAWSAVRELFGGSATKSQIV